MRWKDLEARAMNLCFLSLALLSKVSISFVRSGLENQSVWLDAYKAFWSWISLDIFSKSSKHRLNTFVSISAFHGSHFEVIIDQRIQLSFRGYKLAYYNNGVQNLAVSAADPSTRVFYVFSTLTKSTHFVYNNLQTSHVDGSSTIVLSIPHPYPDDLISFFDNSTVSLS